MCWHQLAYFLLKKDIGWRILVFDGLGTAFLPTAKSPSHMPRVNMQRNANANEKKLSAKRKLNENRIKRETPQETQQENTPTP